MYNRYLNHEDYVLIDPDPTIPSTPPKSDRPTSSSLLGEVGGSLSKWLHGLSQHISLEQFDTGDILLVLIILFLFLEGDNLELVITLGLMLLFALKED